MDKIRNLQEKGALLHAVLSQYSANDKDVREVLNDLMPLLESINHGKVTPPVRFEFGWLFFRGDNNLLSYPEITNAAADFANALEDREGATTPPE